jgi:2-haloacid dehalogenase
MDAVLFDLGKVLLDWSPRYYYERFFAGDEAGLARFLDEVIAREWILEMDRGLPMAEAIAARQQLYPEHAGLIARWEEGWPEMLRGEIAGTVAVLDELAARGRRLFALTNFSHETWPVARARFEFLGRFEDVVVSGEVGMVKPDPRIYRLAIGRCRLDPARTVFVDDLAANVEAARAEGLHGLHFTTPERLREELAALGAL